MNEASALATSGFLPWIEFGPVRIQSYFVIISLVLSAIAFWIPRRAEDLDFSSRRALDLYIFMMIGGFLGARLFHIVWEEPRYYAEDPMLVFDIMSGGFVWYGGAIGGFLALVVAMLNSHRGPNRMTLKNDLIAWLDFYAPMAAVGYAAGRVACVLTGCCFGRVLPFPFTDDGHGHSLLVRFPTQAFAVLWELGVAYILWRAERQRWKRGRKSGSLFAFWILLHGLGRTIMEVLRADPRGPTIGWFSISMALSLILILIASAALWQRQLKTA